VNEAEPHACPVPRSEVGVRSTASACNTTGWTKNDGARENNSRSRAAAELRYSPKDIDSRRRLAETADASRGETVAPDGLSPSLTALRPHASKRGPRRFLDPMSVLCAADRSRDDNGHKHGKNQCENDEHGS